MRRSFMILLIVSVLLVGFYGAAQHVDWRSKYQAFIVRQFHIVFYSGQTWIANRWLGIPAEQNPNDVWITQEIISEVKPDLIIETGTSRGGSALIWATILCQVNPGGRVLTIDVEDRTQNASKLALFRECVEFIKANSTDPSLAAYIGRRAKDKRVLVLLDSDHHRDHVLREMELYGPMVSVGSYMIVQDGNIGGHPVRKDYGPGPTEAIGEYLVSHGEFVVDRNRGERLLLTMHPNGYLRRVR